MAYRYPSSSTCYSPREVNYGQGACIRLIEIKSGEVQAVRLNYRSEIANQVFNASCIIDFDVIETVHPPLVTPVKVSNGGNITVDVIEQINVPQPINANDGTVTLNIGLSDVNIRYNDVWQVLVMVDLEDGRRLTEEFRVRAIKAATVHTGPNFIITASSDDGVEQDLKLYNITGVTANLSLAASQFTDSDGTLGLSADTTLGDVTVTIPAGLDDRTELILENVATVNSLFVVVAGGSETILNDPTGIEIDRDGGVTIKKSGNNWIVVGKYISSDTGSSQSGAQIINQTQDLSVFNITGIVSDYTITEGEFALSDYTLGISSNTSISDITITVPQGLPDNSELTIDNTTGTNSIFVVVAGGVETISLDITGIEIDRDGGLTLKKVGSDWLVLGKYTSN